MHNNSIKAIDPSGLCFYFSITAVVHNIAIMGTLGALAGGAAGLALDGINPIGKAVNRLSLVEVANRKWDLKFPFPS